MSPDEIYNPRTRPLDKVTLLISASAKVDTTTPLPELFGGTQWSTCGDSELEDVIRYAKKSQYLNVPNEWIQYLRWAEGPTLDHGVITTRVTFVFLRFHETATITDETATITDETATFFFKNLDDFLCWWWVP